MPRVNTFLLKKYFCIFDVLIYMHQLRILYKRPPPANGRGLFEYSYFILKQLNPVSFALASCFVAPDGGLHLSYVSLPQKEHTHAALTDSASYRIWKLAVHKRAVEGQIESFAASRGLKLRYKRVFVNAYSHRRKLEGAVKR